VNEVDVKLALLQEELRAIQGAIRSFDTMAFQIKGWCVTASLAIGGFAVAYRKPALLLVGVGAVLGFFLVECQIKMFQRAFIERNNTIDSELRNVGVMETLKGQGGLNVVGTAARLYGVEGRPSIPTKLRKQLPKFWHEIRVINTFTLYLLIGLCLVIEAAILML